MPLANDQAITWPRIFYMMWNTVLGTIPFFLGSPNCICTPFPHSPPKDFNLQIEQIFHWGCIPDSFEIFMYSPQVFTLPFFKKIIWSALIQSCWLINFRLVAFFVALCRSCVFWLWTISMCNAKLWNKFFRDGLNGAIYTINGAVTSLDSEVLLLKEASDCNNILMGRSYCGL